ncbi:MAG: YraN family protein [Nitrospira bacterium HGW-Nitrospira-1]|nr:MAG: YraN family protein [Nitrospira bacterium HGW-Nitrospira-1]
MNTLGKEGEDMAADFLKKKGFGIIKKNYRTVFGEIDIIAKDKDIIVFVEVKTRTDNVFAHPFEAVNQKKRDKIRKVALCFMKTQKKEFPARFDVLSITSDRGETRIEHIKDAFEI